MTVSKIQILGGPKEYVPVLQAHIGAENLPSNYGGSLPPLDCDIHPYTEIMTDYAALNNNDNNNSCCNEGEITTSSSNNEAKSDELEVDIPINMMQLGIDRSKLYQSYLYPENTPGADSKINDKYWNNLNELNLSKLHIIRDWLLSNDNTNEIDKKDHDLLVLHSLHPSLVYLRYLRANQFDINKTKIQIKNSIEWRKKINIDILVTR